MSIFLRTFNDSKISIERLKQYSDKYFWPGYISRLLSKYLLLKRSPRTCAPGCALFPGSQSFPVCQSKKYVVGLVLVSSLLVNCPRLPLHSLRKIWDLEAPKRLWGFFTSSSFVFSSSPPLPSPSDYYWGVNIIILEVAEVPPGNLTSSRRSWLFSKASITPSTATASPSGCTRFQTLLRVSPYPLRLLFQMSHNSRLAPNRRRTFLQSTSWSFEFQWRLCPKIIIKAVLATSEDTWFFLQRIQSWARTPARQASVSRSAFWSSQQWKPSSWTPRRSGTRTRW